MNKLLFMFCIKNLKPYCKIANTIYIALLIIVFSGWYFCIEMPGRLVKAEVFMHPAKNTRRIIELDLDLVFIPPGQYNMGTPRQSDLMGYYYNFLEFFTGKKNNYIAWNMECESPATSVILTHQFWLGRTPVTQGQYQKIMGTNPSHFAAQGQYAPVEEVSWDDAMEFCHKLTIRERSANRLPYGYIYTLPTEAEWEYACRAGTTDEYAGDIDKMAWYRTNSGNSTHPVGLKLSNRWGLYDMNGNVWQWCLDWYGDYHGGIAINPRGPSTGFYHVSRGGSWCNSLQCMRASCRNGNDGVEINAVASDGFRIALVPQL